MIVIKEGNKDRLEKRRYFKCPICGCLYSATKDEYNYDFDQREGEEWYSCKCPMNWCGGTGSETSYSEVEIYIGDQAKWDKFCKTN